MLANDFLSRDQEKIANKFLLCEHILRNGDLTRLASRGKKWPDVFIE